MMFRLKKDIIYDNFFINSSFVNDLYLVYCVIETFLLKRPRRLMFQIFAGSVRLDD
jgi:hypothetical protein